MGDRQLEVESIEPGSIAEELGIEPGDTVLRINDKPAADIIDYCFLTAEEEVNILLQKPDNSQWLLEIEKDWDEELGIIFKEGGLGATRSCRNKCIFCFVDQMPPDMRDSLYVKDDDYRLSFFQGNFISLTNVSDRELQRIAEQKLSPLYISVHTTNPRLRVKMMRNPAAAKIMDQLRYLAGSGVEIHTQAVLCPGINTGEELERTVADLSDLWPSVHSLALVPVGLTGYREKLYPLRKFNSVEAVEIIQRVYQWQKVFTKQKGYPLVFASDEFYLLAGKPVPPADHYGGFPQTENGVGLIRLFVDSWNEIKSELPRGLPSETNLKLVTGELAASVLDPVVNRLNKVENLSVELVAVKNNFFGADVTVAGLLTAADITGQIKVCGNTGAVIVPEAALRSGEPVFLDGPSLDELSHKLGVPVLAAGNPQELVEIIKQLDL